MSRRPVLFAISLAALAATACADTTAPTSAAPSARQLQPSDRAAKDVVNPETCKGGQMTSTGRTC